MIPWPPKAVRAVVFLPGGSACTPGRHLVWILLFLLRYSFNRTGWRLRGQSCFCGPFHRNCLQALRCLLDIRHDRISPSQLSPKDIRPSRSLEHPDRRPHHRRLEGGWSPGYPTPSDLQPRRYNPFSCRRRAPRHRVPRATDRGPRDHLA